MRGLFFITPFIATLFLIISVVEWINDKLNDAPFRGGALFIFIVSLLAGIALIGYVGSSLVVRPIGFLIESYIKKVPVIGFIYTSLKDVVEAFMGEKKKFDTPIIVKVRGDEDLYRPGFITQKDLSNLGLEGRVAVYLPHSYAFSGQVFIVDKSCVELLDVSGSDMMKFIVSGGVGGMELKSSTKKEE